MMIFVAITVLETAHVLDTPWRAAVALAVTLVLPFFFAVQNDWFSVVGLVRLIPFFILGLSVNRFRHLLQHPSLPWIVTGVFVIAMGKHWLGVLGLVGQSVPRLTPMATVIGVSAVLAAWYWVPRAQLLERLGNFSFSGLRLSRLLRSDHARSAAHHGIDQLVRHFLRLLRMWRDGSDLDVDHRRARIDRAPGRARSRVG